MARPTEIHTVIEDAVAEILAAATPRLRQEIVRRVTAEFESLVPEPGSSPIDILSAAVTTIQESNSQAEILRHLLESEARFAGRVALFVVKGNAISGWEAAGFKDNNFIRAAVLANGTGLVERALHGREPAAGSTADFDPAFFRTTARPAADSCLVLPLVVNGKVAAVIYADGGTSQGGSYDASALSVLTQWAALWLELSALRKLGAAHGEGQQAAASAAVPAAPSGSDDPELHQKARRFAKLLVEEIKLYNQPRVVEGKLNRDLYERLKVDIEKSRATYDKRYRETAVASADYFNQELIRILADNDVSLLGSSFPR